jgi:hypothetical protein
MDAIPRQLGFNLAKLRVKKEDQLITIDAEAIRNNLMKYTTRDLVAIVGKHRLIFKQFQQRLEEDERQEIYNKLQTQYAELLEEWDAIPVPAVAPEAEASTEADADADAEAEPELLTAKKFTALTQKYRDYVNDDFQVPPPSASVSE